MTPVVHAQQRRLARAVPGVLVQAPGLLAPQPPWPTLRMHPAVRRPGPPDAFWRPPPQAQVSTRTRPADPDRPTGPPARPDTHEKRAPANPRPVPDRPPPSGSGILSPESGAAPRALPL